MNVIDVASEIIFVANGMLPEPPLPQRLFAAGVAPAGRIGGDQTAAEIAFDPSPSAGEIRVAGRQGEHRVQAVRQDHDGIDRERAFAPGGTKCRAQNSDVIDKHR